MTKQELIQNTYEALGFVWAEIEKFVDNDGWTKHKVGEPNNLCSEGVTYRPFFPDGFDSNNGWIKIEKGNDLPEDFQDCHTFDVAGNYGRANLKADRNSLDYCNRKSISHYQIAVKPLPPIY